MKFEFATATRIVFGAGAIRDVGALAGPFGKRALVVTGKDPARADKLLALLGPSIYRVATFSVIGEPDILTVENGVTLARKEKCDFVVGFGGGSALDTAK
ncbi:MAG: iron-containing alcohol dehydrogenase, partial [Limisphaerales bacterium]